MKSLRRLTAILTAVAMLGSSSFVSADQYCNECDGCGYEACRQSCVKPYIVLGTVAVAAIIAVVAYRGSDKGSPYTHNYHGHAHTN